MAVDKIIQEFEIRTQKAEAELKELDQRLGRIEKDGKQAGKATGEAFAKGSKKAKSSLKGVQNQSSELQNTVKRLGQTIAAAFAVREIINFTKRSIELANVQQAAEAQLLTALRGRKDVQQALIAQAAGLQKITTFGDEQIIQAQSMIAAFVQEEDQIKELTRVSLDFAAAKGVDLKTASDLITKTFASSTNALSRYGLSVEGAAGSQERLESVTGALDKAFKGQAETLAQTGTGQMQQFQNAVGDLQEEFGKKLLPVLNRTAKSLTEFLQSTDPEDIIKMAEAAGKLALVFGAFKLGKLISSFKSLNVVMKANPFGLVLSAAAALVAFLPDIIDGLNGVNETQRELETVAYNATKGLREEQAELNLLAEALRKTNPESAERERLLKKFNELSPIQIENLKDTAKFNDALTAAMATTNEQYDKRIEVIGRQAAMEAAVQKQIELKAKIQAEEDRLVRETGEGYDELRKAAKEYIEYQQTGAFPALSRLKNTLLRGSVKELAELQYEYENTTTELKKLKDEAENMEGAAKNLNATTSLSAVEMAKLRKTVAGDDDKDPKKSVLGAFEALNKRASELQEAIRNALASGDMAGASQLTRILDDVQAKIDFLNATLEGLNKPVDINLAEPVITTEEEGEQTIDEWVQGFQKKLTDNPLRVKINLDTSDSDDPTDPFGSPEQFEKIQGAVGGVQNAFQGLNDYLISAGLQNSQFQQSVAIFQITLQQAQAIAGAIRAATEGAKDPFTLIASIGTVVGAVLSTFAQVNSILNSAQQPQRPTGFFEGTDYLTRNGAPAGKDTIPAMLNEGEAVIPTADNAKYPGLAKSWINGDLDNYIYRNWVAPALSEAEAKKNESMADNLAKSIAMNMKGGFDDYRLYRTTKEGNSLLGQIAQNTKNKPSKKRRYN